MHLNTSTQMIALNSIDFTLPRQRGRVGLSGPGRVLFGFLHPPSGRIEAKARGFGEGAARPKAIAHLANLPSPRRRTLLRDPPSGRVNFVRLTCVSPLLGWHGASNEWPGTGNERKSTALSWLTNITTERDEHLKTSPSLGRVEAEERDFGEGLAWRKIADNLAHQTSPRRRKLLRDPPAGRVNFVRLTCVDNNAHGRVKKDLPKDTCLICRSGIDLD